MAGARMTADQIVMLIVLAGTIGMFVWGRWRHDMVALAALIGCVAAGLVPAGAAFAGFGHPAVITVACVLVLSRGLQTSGAIDLLAQRALPAEAGPATMIAALCLLVAALSAFMNNVGALALLMPVALQVAAKQGVPPGRLLMPLAFASILGGMTTLIGTPPNLIVAAFCAGNGGPGPFGMFDFTPVGLAVALAGIAFITLLGWRLVPDRRRAGVEGFETAAYLTEARVPEKAKAIGMTLGEVERALVKADVQVIGLVRGEVRLAAPRPHWRVRAGDILQKADVRLIGYAGGGTRNIFANVPVANMAELKGCRSACGARRSAAENAAAGIEQMKFYEVGPYVAPTQHAITVRPRCISNKTFTRLPEKLRQCILDAGAQAGAFGRDLESGQDAEKLQTMRDKGLLQTVAFTDRAELLALARPVIQAYAEELDAAAVLAAVDAVQ
jgi:hypothetical protein